ncbi:MAG: hypothetical protein AAF772_05920 [Acidobacteriota bacterium]
MSSTSVSLNSNHVDHQVGFNPLATGFNPNAPAGDSNPNAANGDSIVAPPVAQDGYQDASPPAFAAMMGGGASPNPFGG